MLNDSANQLPVSQERSVSPKVLADLFNTAAEGMLRTDAGQRLGNYVVGYETGAGIKQHPVRERVTHAELWAYTDATGPVRIHEVHFPSRDKQAGDFDPGVAIFEMHAYDEFGTRTGTERTVFSQVDMAGSAVRPFVEQFDDLNK